MAFPLIENRRMALSVGVRPSGVGIGAVNGLSACENTISGMTLVASASLAMSGDCTGADICN